ncbi:MAG: erythromycin esterase family protein [Thermoproteota archaeon]|nr:erythromycin esterase family protein [Thermoproteota archaeon]
MTELNYTLLNDSSHDLDLLLDRVGESQFVLLGEASHGTSEFYKWRSEISKRLIKEKGFSFIAVEGDWPDCFEVNRYIKGFSGSGQSAYKVLHSFNRWPTWMWANKEMVDLIEWIKVHNSSVIGDSRKNKVGFYGLDLYSLWESLEAIIQYLKRVDPAALKNAVDAFDCFEPYNKDVEKYANAMAFVPDNCEDEVIETLASLRNKQDVYAKEHQNKEEEYFNAEQNAITAKEAEKYYRTMMKGDVNSWNLRDTHMMNTLERLIDFHNKDKETGDGRGNVTEPKSIVWAHNTHIGDARFTDMAKSGMINLGQLVREKRGSKNTVLVGFGTYSGSVIASKQWGEKMEKMDVPPAKDGSWDRLLHNLCKSNSSDDIGKDKLLIFSSPHQNHEDKDDAGKTTQGKKNNYTYYYDDDTENDKPMGQRAIGVVYNPKYEKYGNYVPTKLSSRYDALLFIDKTNALSPLHMQPIKNDRDLPETFPSGV